LRPWREDSSAGTPTPTFLGELCANVASRQNLTISATSAEFSPRHGFTPTAPNIGLSALIPRLSAESSRAFVVHRRQPSVSFVTFCKIAGFSSEPSVPLVALASAGRHSTGKGVARRARNLPLQPDGVRPGNLGSRQARNRRFWEIGSTMFRRLAFQPRCRGSDCRETSQPDGVCARGVRNRRRGRRRPPSGGGNEIIIPADIFLLPEFVIVTSADIFLLPVDVIVAAADLFLLPENVILISADIFLLPENLFLHPENLIVISADTFLPPELAIVVPEVARGAQLAFAPSARVGS
jgi:hypothetical protein